MATQPSSIGSYKNTNTVTIDMKRKLSASNKSKIGYRAGKMKKK